MKLIAAFFRLVRWPNLAFIALTQCLFYFAVYFSLKHTGDLPHTSFEFYMLVAASVLIAAGGYVINDYFDLHIDAVNKPQKVVVDRILKRRWAIAWHAIFSLLGIVASAFVAYRTGSRTIFFLNIACVFLLWVYSTTFKKKLLIGNIIIAALTAWVIIVVYIFAGAHLGVWNPGNDTLDQPRFFKFTILYAGFAFIMSIIREVTKDLEDLEGDARYGCRTMPIVWGVPATKVFAAVWIVACIATLAILQLYAWQSGHMLVSLYTLITIIVPLVIVLRKLYVASVPADYHVISSYLKVIMFAGIISMIFFRFLEI